MRGNYIWIGCLETRSELNEGQSIGREEGVEEITLNSEGLVIEKGNNFSLKITSHLLACVSSMTDNKHTIMQQYVIDNKHQYGRQEW